MTKLPESRPNLLYYDANCRFCAALARRLAKLDRRRVLELRPGPDDDARRAGLDESDLRRSAYLLDPDGQAFEGFFAVRKPGPAAAAPAPPGAPAVAARGAVPGNAGLPLVRRPPDAALGLRGGIEPAGAGLWRRGPV